jgi:hypothetical protein
MPKTFVERYLSTHADFLKSLADITSHLYFKNYEDWHVACTEMLVKLAAAGSIPEMEDTEGETVHFRNLRNAWYHEAALNYPQENLDTRMLFAAWKIIQFYYTVFSSASTVVCLDDPDRKTHNIVIGRYMVDFICNSRRAKFCLPPTNFYLDQNGNFSKRFSEAVNWKYADESHLPTIEKCLNYSKEIMNQERNCEHRRIGILDYLKVLRDWTNYQDAYIFFRLYGPSVKANLDYSLKRISFTYLTQTEFFMLKTFGWGPLRAQYRSFREELENNLGIKSPQLDERFSVYSSNKELFG